VLAIILASNLKIIARQEFFNSCIDDVHWPDKYQGLYIQYPISVRSVLKGLYPNRHRRGLGGWASRIQGVRPMLGEPRSSWVRRSFAAWALRRGMGIVTAVALC